MYQFVLILHVLAAVCIIILVLLQQGKGATMGAAFGSGASQTVFGSRGSGSFLLKVTIGFVMMFFATSIVLNNIATHAQKSAQEVVLPLGLPETPAPSQISGVPVVTPNSIPNLPENVSTKDIPSEPVTVMPSSMGTNKAEPIIKTNNTKDASRVSSEGTKPGVTNP